MAQTFGVDKVAVSFPVTSVAPDADWHTLSIRNSSQGPAISRQDRLRVAEGVHVMIGVSDIDATGMQWAKVEGNPSRLRDPDGWKAEGTAGDTLDLVHTAISHASKEGYFQPLVNSAREARLKRLDVARDFHDVTQPSSTLGGLIGVHRNHARQARVYYDPNRNGAQTLVVGGKRDQVRMYDKEQETGGDAAGVMRAEFMCRSWLTRYGDMRLLGDITDDRIGSLGRDRWEWSGMGTNVSSSFQGIAQAVARLDLSPTKQRHLLGYLIQQATGLPTKCSRTTAAEYRRLAREAGVAMALDGLDQSDDPGFFVHLDLEEGREVLSVGA